MKNFFSLISFQTSFGRGFFELEILEFTNYRGELASGACCGGIPRSEPCRIQCQTFFRVCLKEYQINVTSTGSCSFGNTSSPVLGGNSFSLQDPESANGKLVLPFSFSWTVSFFFIFRFFGLWLGKLIGIENLVGFKSLIRDLTDCTIRTDL